MKEEPVAWLSVPGQRWKRSGNSQGPFGRYYGRILYVEFWGSREIKEDTQVCDLYPWTDSGMLVKDKCSGERLGSKGHN